MKICVIGVGYVGLVVGTCLAELGNDVICVDSDKDKINKLNKGVIPIYEPGLKELVDRSVREKRLFFSIDADSSIQKSGVIFIAVGTPQGSKGKADLTSIFNVAERIGQNLNEYKVVVVKSTVPVGTTEKVRQLIKKNSLNKNGFDVVSNPEFLREGEAVNDFLFPDRVVIGVESEKAKKKLEELYSGIVRIKRPLIITDVKSAEMIKYAANSMLATRISFMNEIARLCEKVGADVKIVSKGIGLDSRIGPRFLQAGAGYGGSCFPKDVQAFIKTAEENGIEFKILKAVEKVNEEQKKSLFEKLKKFIPNLNGKKIALCGLAFKPKTDDIREAPALTLINQLLNEGAIVQAFDPEAENNIKKVFPQIKCCSTPYNALEGCSALVIVTEWNEFRNLDKEKIKSLLLEPVIVDGRNVYEPKEMKELGFKYVGIGR